MPSPSSNGGPAFRLEISDAIRELILKLQLQASNEGRGDVFIRAMEKVFNNLKSHANTLGEPLYDLPMLKLQVRATIVPPIALHYGVDHKHHVVYFKTIILLDLPTS